MINPNYRDLHEDLVKFSAPVESDFPYVLRNVLYRGAREAERRSFMCEDHKRSEYKRIIFELDDLSDDLDTYIAEDGTIKAKHRVTLSEAAKIATLLLAMDQEETNAKVAGILHYLTHDLDEDSLGDVLAA